MRFPKKNCPKILKEKKLAYLKFLPCCPLGVDFTIFPFESFLRVSRSCSRTACAIGTIIAVVATFDIHIEMKEVVAIKPASNHIGLVRVTNLGVEIIWGFQKIFELIKYFWMEKNIFGLIKKF